MDSLWVILISVIYLSLLFGIALFGHRRAKTGHSLVNHPFIYALSLTVYCTVWTFYGSIGLAASSGLEYLPVYLGPAVLAPVWYMLIRKIILISNHLRITSIADFISSRYGKSTLLGVLTTWILLISIIPYISIQLKAIGFSFDILTKDAIPGNLLDASDFYKDKVNYFTILLAIFTILFGTRHLDPFERHEGLVAAIAFESLLKLVAFLTAGIYLVYFAFNGLGDVFYQAMDRSDLRALLTLSDEPATYSHWFWVMILSAFAIMFLPRQFHVTVVENTNISFTRQASWLLPLYLFLICLFVLPIAIIGRISLPENSGHDTFLLSLPLHFDQPWLALLVYIGGFSAAASMVVVSVIAMSIMVSNNLLMPFLLKTRTAAIDGFALPGQRLLEIRRVIIIVVLFLAYGFYSLVSKNFSLVSIGLTSFVAVLQLAPPIIGGIFWTKANKKGAVAGLLAGFTIWFMTLFYPLFAEAGIIDSHFLENGYWSQPSLRPYQFLGLENVTPISNACIWSIIFNAGLFVAVSLSTKQEIEEISQADIFKNINKYSQDPDLRIIGKEASVPQLKKVLVRYLGIQKTRDILSQYTGKVEVVGAAAEQLASTEFINYVEKILAGAFGSSSAHIIMSSEITKENITPQQLISILDQTKKILEYSAELEEKTTKLQETTLELEAANRSLKKLDVMKAEFISTVTHELRTPITSIRSFSQILASHQHLSPEKKEEFLHIILMECDRISRLINQVLHIEKLDNIPIEENQIISVRQTVETSISRFYSVMSEKSITISFSFPEKDISVKMNEDSFLQVMLNLISNAIKFCDSQRGKIHISVTLVDSGQEVTTAVFNNGQHIPDTYKEHIFDKFIQVKEGNVAKPEGSGLGLFITKKIIAQAGGHITYTSEAGKGTTFYFSLPIVR